MDIDMLTGPLKAQELSCIEMGDNVCTHGVWFPTHDIHKVDIFYGKT